jgi:hypothetical protein
MSPGRRRPRTKTARRGIAQPAGENVSNAERFRVTAPTAPLDGAPGLFPLPALAVDDDPPAARPTPSAKGNADDTESSAPLLAPLLEFEEGLIEPALPGVAALVPEAAAAGAHVEAAVPTLAMSACA